jgi:hypothetical protein
VIWEYNTGFCVDSPSAIVDFDNDGVKEVIYGAWKEGDDLGYVRILNGVNGSLEQKIGGFDGYIQSEPNILDLDGNGQLDIVITTFQGDNKIYAINGSDYSVMWEFQTGDWMYHGGSFGDIDNDGLPEIAIGSYDDYVYVINAEDGSLEWSKNTGSYILAPTSLADVNNDGTLEVFAATYYLHAFTHDGSVLWSYPTGGLIWRGSSIADIDGDGWLDVCFCSDDGSIRIVNGTTGDLLWSFDAEADYGDTFEIDHAPVIADFNGDGSLDVFFVGGYGVYPPDNNYGRAYAFSLLNGTGVGWYMFRHDYLNSGCYAEAVNNPPLIPQIPSGPLSGNTEVLYDYTTNTTDPESNQVYYQWDWDDMVGNWFGPYASGESCEASHSWSTEGIYQIRVRVKDNWGHTSNWSEALLVTIADTLLVTNLSQQWNFISFPVNDSIYFDDLFIAYNDSFYNWTMSTTDNNPTGSPLIDSTCFGWVRSNQYYITEQSLEPGYGWWMYCYEPCALWIQNVIVSEANPMTIVESGWNIIGNPYGQIIEKSVILVNDSLWNISVAAGLVDDTVFGWNPMIQQYYIATSLNPGEAYWLYAYDICILKRMTS